MNKWGDSKSFNNQGLEVTGFRVEGVEFFWKCHIFSIIFEVGRRRLINLTAIYDSLLQIRLIF